MSLDILGVYATATAAVSAILLQFIKTILIDPYVTDGVRRDTLLRGIGYLVNFALLLAILLTHNQYQPEYLFDYLLLALGQQTVSHIGYKVLSTKTSRPKAPVVAAPAPHVSVGTSDAAIGENANANATA
jgi:hypothetical protein